MGSCLSSRATSQSMLAVNWIELPNELVSLISQCFDNELDLIRFRSVCSNWCSSSINNNNKDNPFCCCYLSKQSVFLVKPQQQLAKTLVRRPWFIRISQNSSGQNKLFHPLLPNYLPISFPHVFDFNKVSILHLRTELRSDFNMDYFNNPNKVVAVTCHGKKKTLVLGTLSSTPQSLLLKCGDENWNEIPGMSIEFRDVCLFKGRSYVVDKTGRTVVVVGPDDSIVQLVAESLVGGGDIKFLVESKGDLLLVDVYECARFGFPGHGPVKIHLFKLNEKETEWVKLKSLGDLVLFLGDDCSFSASASDLSVAKGNCVIFMENVFPSFQHLRFFRCPRGLTSTIMVTHS